MDRVGFKWGMRRGKEAPSLAHGVSVEKRKKKEEEEEEERKRQKTRMRWW
jgi:hypothetical protein